MRGALTRLGVGQGDRVALLCANGRFFVVTYLATIGLGAVAVPLNPSSPALELERELMTVDAKVVAVHPSAVNAWKKVDRAKVPTVQHVIAADSTIPDASSSTRWSRRSQPTWSRSSRTPSRR
jgi:acyl-CoA synthetase (AMP-forming)/AMP-acid ligase II